MNNLIKRVTAYIIDMLIITLIVQSLAGTTIINKDLNKYNKYNKEYTNSYSEYMIIKQDLIDSYKDNKITKEEYDKLLKHKKYNSIINSYYEDNKITEKELIKINNKIDEEFYKESKKTYCNLEKNSKYYLVIYIIIVIGYFIVFNIITDGRTLGKKLMRLKIVDINNESAPLKGYIIRSIFLYQLLLYITRLVLINTLNNSDYYNAITIINNIMIFVEIAIIVMVGLRKDERGLHDLLAGTKVVRLDKQGNIINTNNPIVRKKENSTTP